MQASSVINYHYYGHHLHQTTTGDANCQLGGASDGHVRSLVTPNQATDVDGDDLDHDAENSNRGHLQAAAIITNESNQDIQSNETMLGQFRPEDGQKVQFVESRLACGQIAYESHENSQEHYRYQTTAAAYHQEDESHYYEQQQQHQNQHLGKQQEHIGGQLLVNQTIYHHQPPQDSLAIAPTCRQAVDLSSEQSAHGPFQTTPPIYYDLSSASIPDQTSSSANTLEYSHAHHNPNQINHQQDVLLEPQRSANFFFHQPADHYETGCGSELRYSAEFVSVLTEQNRFARTLDWQEGLQVAGADQQVTGCHHTASYSYDPIESSLRSTGDTQLDQANSNVVYSNNVFSQVPSDSTVGPSYSQPHLSTVPNVIGNFQPTNNNENYHHAHHQLTGQIGDLHNDCHSNQFNQNRSKNQPNYETAQHLIDQATCSNGPQRDSPSRALSTLSESLSMTTNSDMESIDSALTRDEKKAREANIPLGYHEIVNLSIDQFNEQLLRYPYTEAQLTLMKDIRRRGKNKVAAQTCRKRKMEQITELQREVAGLANKRVLLALERSRLIQEHTKLVEEYDRWCLIVQNQSIVQSQQAEQHVQDINSNHHLNNNHIHHHQQHRGLDGNDYDVWPVAKTHEMGDTVQANRQQVPLC